VKELRTNKIFTSALIVMISYILSRLTGFVREMLIPNYIGLNEVSDAYNMAFRITGLMYDLLVGGAISAAIVPTLSGSIAKNEEKQGWEAVSSFINIALICMVILCFAGIIFAPQLVSFTVLNFKSPAQKELTIHLTRILFPSVAFLMLAGLTTGILQSYNKFIAAAFGPTVYNICCCLSIVLFSKWGIEYITIGVAASSFTYFMLQLSFAIKRLKYYQFKILLHQPGLAKLFGLAIPSLIASSVSQVNSIIIMSFAMLFDEGSVTAYNLADKTWQVPFGIFTVAIAVAMLPNMSAAFATDNLEEYKRIFHRAMRAVLLIIVPSAAGMMLLSNEIAITIFKFSQRASDSKIYLIGEVLIFFCIGLVAQSVVTTLCRAFYAKKDSKTPLYISIATLVITVSVSALFVKFTSLGVRGLALSYSLASIINAGALLYIFNKRLGGIRLGELFKFLMKVLGAATAMVLVLITLMSALSTVQGSKIEQFLILGSKIAIGAGIYACICLSLKIEEAVNIKNIVLGKVKKVYRLLHN